MFLEDIPKITQMHFLQDRRIPTFNRILTSALDLKSIGSARMLHIMHQSSNKHIKPLFLIQHTSYFLTSIVGLKQ